MKIRELTQIQRSNFKQNCPIYLSFLKEKAPQLSHCSHKLYSRALSYIAVENDLLNKTPKELAVSLTKDILTTSDFEKIVGKDTNGNQNIRLSAFRNLVNPFKDSLQEEISAVSFQTLSKLVSRKGTHIRKNIIESKTKNLKTETELLSSRNWKELQEILKNSNKKYGVIVNKFLRTNEIPDYVTLRNITIANLYLNNFHEYDGLKVHVLLRNEYRTCHLWVNPIPPPHDKTNYFWVNFETNEHYMIIQASKTVGGIRRTTSKDGPSVVPQKKRIEFKISNSLVNMLLFIKQTFNERTDIPFFKNNQREGPVSAQEWVRIVNKVFEELAAGITTSTIRKIYFNEIKWDKLTSTQRHYILVNFDNTSGERIIKKNETPPDNPELLSVPSPSLVEETSSGEILHF